MATGTYQYERFGTQGWRAWRLRCQGADGGLPTEACFTPEVGCNLLSFSVSGTEYLQAIAADASILGTPILYPTPNRVKDAQFSFGGRTFRFAPNNGPHFIHGLVRDIPWQCDEPRPCEGGVSATARIAFRPGTAQYERFPIRNTLELTYILTPGKLRLEFKVHNEDRQLLPFGLAIHPYFVILGSRDQVRIQAPVQKRMEAIGLIPTGRLLDLSASAADLRRPVSLEALDLDDVFWGVAPGQPHTIYYDSNGQRLSLRASELFTHSVVYTPRSKPYFCIENQSCSTDAHNLHARGLLQEAHLTILEPGQTLSAWIEFAVSGSQS
jgi:aldose 1-epimerase